MPILESSLGDVLERLLGDLSESKRQEIKEWLAAQGITTWQSFILAHVQDMKQSMGSLNIHLMRNLLDLKDLIMVTFQKHEENAMLPCTYTKGMYTKHVFKLQLEERNRFKESKITCNNTRNDDRKPAARQTFKTESQTEASQTTTTKAKLSWNWLLNADGSFAYGDSSTKKEKTNDSSTVEPATKSSPKRKSPRTLPIRSSQKKQKQDITENRVTASSTANSTTLQQKSHQNSDSSGDSDFEPSTRKLFNKGRKVISEEKTTTNILPRVAQPFAPLTSSNSSIVHTVILGNMPGSKSLAMCQYYGNSQNPFWNIVGSAIGFQRHRTPYAEQVKKLSAKGYCVWNVLSGSNSQQHNNLPGFILNHVNLNRFVFNGNSAETFEKVKRWENWLNTGQVVTSSGTLHTRFWIQGRSLNPGTYARANKIFGIKNAVEIVDDPAIAKSYQNKTTIDKNIAIEQRLVELIILPSTSPANFMVRPPEKEKTWHRVCFRMERPPQNYECPGCKLNPPLWFTPHWFQDCPHREEWKQKKKQENGAEFKSTGEVDRFYWYR